MKKNATTTFIYHASSSNRVPPYLTLTSTMAGWATIDTFYVWYHYHYAIGKTVISQEP